MKSKLKTSILKILSLLFITTFVCAIFVACGETCNHVAGEPVIENVIESTDEADGSYDEVVYCTLCGNELSRDHKTTSAHVHVAGDPIEENRSEAWCLLPGGYDTVVRCTVCNAELSREHHTIPKLGHDLTKHDAKEATCYAVGWKAYETCSRCTYSNYQEIPKTNNHNPADAVEEEKNEATCIFSGWYYSVVYCKDCGQELSRDYKVIKPTGHDTITVQAKEPTCEDVGWYEYEKCTKCNYSTYDEIPSKNHNNTKTEETFTNSTCTKAGGYRMVITCKDCGKVVYEYYEPYELASHYPSSEVKENETTADCYNEGGYDMVVHCSNPDCDYEFSRIHTTIPVTHKPSDVTVENAVSPTYGYNNSGKEGGYDEVIYCSECKNELSRKHVVTKITPSEYYSQYDYLELSDTVNSLDGLIDNKDGTYLLNAKTNGGKAVRLLITGKIDKLDGGWGAIDTDTRIYTLDSIPGVNFVEYELKSRVGADLLAMGYYSLSQKTSVSSFDELFSGGSAILFGTVSKKSQSELMIYPDYLCINSLGCSAEIVDMKIYYCNTASKVKDIQLHTRLYGYKWSQSYLPGDLYDGAIEEIGLNYAFPLKILIDNDKHLAGANEIYDVLLNTTSDVIFGDLYDVNGQVVDKTNRYLQSGDAISVTIGDCTVNIEVCRQAFLTDKVYDTNTIAFVQSIGTQNVLVVPVTFNDQQDRINDEWLTALKGVLGNVMDDNGKVTEYTLSSGNVSLSKYLSTSSYGKFTTNSYITEPYVLNVSGAEAFQSYLSKSIVNDITSWLKTQNFNRAIFDQNNDGYYDIVILANTLQMTESLNGGYLQAGLAGGLYCTFAEDYSDAGTQENPSINACITASSFMLFGSSNLEKANSTTIIHEFGHALGLEDYYDNGKTSNTIGYFDMEADNKGDWNSYSKYILGWIDPVTVDGTQDEVEITISAYATHGDAIVVRALGYKGSGTPFDEYIMIDLFAHDGLYAKDASNYGLQNAVGVRIYHVNSVYDMLTSTNIEKQYTHAWPHYGVTSDYKYASQGKHLIEMIQKGNVNTFMGTVYKDNFVDVDDLFYAGDCFAANEYDNFLYNGKMDNGMDFGYKITVKEIVENGADSKATIVIRKLSTYSE